ncbi:MAG TPA: GTP-binding protein, partial [Flammeovirgaceae bacterium]|nr:GTP-binding protein [Flammeovirgaceae bacterium]
MATGKIRVALVGNPNSGKTSLFNQLTGLNQKVGNFPGVTVDKKIGSCTLPDGRQLEILDLPGSYSIYAKSKDEQVVTDILTNPEDADYPDILVVIADASNLKRNLLLLSQVADLGLPVVLALNMMDLAERMGKKIDANILEQEFGVPVVAINARKGEGINDLKTILAQPVTARQRPFLDVTELAGPKYGKLINQGPEPQYLRLHQLLSSGEISAGEARSIQTRDTTLRYGKINKIVARAEKPTQRKGLKLYTDKIDAILTHRLWGYLIFIFIMFLIFQAIFSWASWPM